MAKFIFAKNVFITGTDVSKKNVLSAFISVLLLSTIFGSYMVLPIAVASSWTTVYIYPASITGPPPGISKNFTVYIKIQNVTDLYTYGIALSWNPSVLECLSWTYNTTFFAPDLTMPGAIDNTAGKIDPAYGATLTDPPHPKGVNGSGTLAGIKFKVVGYGKSWINFTECGMMDSWGNDISRNLVNGTFLLPPPYGPTANKTHTPLIPLVGKTVTFDASASKPGFNGTRNVAIANYTWNFGDGTPITTVTSPIIYHTYTTAGNFTVSLTVKCKNDPVLIALGLTSNSTWQKITVKAPPHAEFTYSPPSPQVFDLVTFNATKSYDPDGAIVNYTWNFGDNNITTGNYMVITHNYTTFGNYKVNLTVTDNDNLKNFTVTTVTVRKHPVASFNYSPTEPKVNETVTFNASASTPDGGNLVSYIWNFDDGHTKTVSVAITTHKYSDYGEYNVTLTVVDSEQKNDTTWKTIKVYGYPRPPVATFVWSPPYPLVNNMTIFNASDSEPGFDGWNMCPIANYTWDFGDGNITTTNSPMITHNYTDVGTYTVNLTVTAPGAIPENNSMWQDIAVYPVGGYGPKANFTYPPIRYMTIPLIFNASGSEPGWTGQELAPIVSYEWGFGDGTPVVTEPDPIITHAYSIYGKYNVTLTVKDSQGLKHAKTITVYVRLLGDATGYPIPSPPDGKVWVEDLWMFGKAWGSKIGDPDYNPLVDFTGYPIPSLPDGKVWVEDLFLLGKNWGKRIQ